MQGMPQRNDESALTFAARLQNLVNTVHPPGRERFTQKEIVAGIREFGGDISQQYLSELLRGVRTDPSERIVRYLAMFFGVTEQYFVEDAEYQRTNDYIALLRQVADTELLSVSARAIDLPPEAIDRISKAVEEERRRAGLD